MKAILVLATCTMLAAPAFAVERSDISAAPKAASLQAQIDALRQQVAELQKKVAKLRGAPHNSVCISLRCA